MKKWHIIIICAALLVITGCATNPATMPTPKDVISLKPWTPINPDELLRSAREFLQQGKVTHAEKLFLDALCAGADRDTVGEALTDINLLLDQEGKGGAK